MMTASAQTVDSIGWRSVFTEPQLVSLIETALERNADLRTANLNVVQAAADNASQGAIAALEEAGITNMPVITGQDNSVKSQEYIKNGKQTMTIDKNLKEMAYNTAMIINSLVNNSPIRTSQSISGIPVFYSKITVMTQVCRIAGQRRRTLLCRAKHSPRRDHSLRQRLDEESHERDDRL